MAQVERHIAELNYMLAALKADANHPDNLYVGSVEQTVNLLVNLKYELMAEERERMTCQSNILREKFKKDQA
jgi:hypothetical protein